MMTTDQLMGAMHMLMGNAEMEAQTTKKIIAAIPADKTGFVLGEKGRTTLELAQHLAATDVWFLNGIIAKDLTAQADEAGTGSTPAAIVAWYEKAFAEAAAKVKALPPDHLATPVDFYGMFNFPAALYLQFLSNHMIHHRGQLSMHLRAMNAHVPQIYGPSADEPMTMSA